LPIEQFGQWNHPERSLQDGAVPGELVRVQRLVEQIWLRRDAVVKGDRALASEALGEERERA
jgi:hypothetical protein